MNYNYACIDIETTGLNKENDQILELAVVLDDLSQDVAKEDLDEYVKQLPTFHCYIKHERIVGDPYAIAMHNRIFNFIAKEPITDIEQLLDSDYSVYKNYLVLDPSTVHYELKEFLSTYGILSNSNKIVAAGKNLASFDIPFLENTLPGFDPKKEGNLFKFHHRLIDIGNFYLEKTDRVPPDLQTCLQRAGLTGIVTHRAVDDATDCIRAMKVSRLHN
jgi:oligoribonuclease (3'-5' exoribonuclease)